MRRIGGIQYKILLCVAILTTMGLNTVYVGANNMTQMELVQSIVNEQLLHEDGSKPEAQNPIVEEVLRIRGRRTGETLTGYLRKVAKDLMPTTFFTQYNAIDVILHKGRLIIRLTRFTGDMFELNDWMEEVASTILDITDEETIEEVSIQVWVKPNAVVANKYER